MTLLEIQLDVLFARDAAGRLVATRDPAPRPAPRLHLGRSRAGNVWATRRDVDPATSAALERLCGSEPPLASPHPSRPRPLGLLRRHNRGWVRLGEAAGDRYPLRLQETGDVASACTGLQRPELGCDLSGRREAHGKQLGGPAELPLCEGDITRFLEPQQSGGSAGPGSRLDV